MSPRIAAMRCYGDTPRCNWLLLSDAGWMEGREGWGYGHRLPTHRKPKADVIYSVWMTTLLGFMSYILTHTFSSHARTHAHTHTVHPQTAFSSFKTNNSSQLLWVFMRQSLLGCRVVFVTFIKLQSLQQESEKNALITFICVYFLNILNLLLHIRFYILQRDSKSPGSKFA